MQVVVAKSGFRPARVFLVLVALGVIAATSYFALRSSPRLVEIRWLPYWLSSWADAYGVARNVLAFGVVGLAAFGASAAQRGTGQRTKPEKENDKENEKDFVGGRGKGQGARGQSTVHSSRVHAVMFVALAVFATGLEVAQLWIPGRWFDWKDIVASIGGLAIGALVVRLARLGFGFCVLSSRLGSAAPMQKPVVTGTIESGRIRFEGEVLERDEARQRADGRTAGAALEQSGRATDAGARWAAEAAKTAREPVVEDVAA